LPKRAFSDLTERRRDVRGSRRPPWKEAVMSNARQQVGLHVRWMIRRDMADVLQIENDTFEFSWSEEEFIRCLRQRNCIGMVAELNDRVVGYMIYELHKNRLHVLNFAVDPSHRRSGIGARMLSKLVGKLSAQRRCRIMLEVRETNLAAQLFFRSQGFKAVSVLRDFYDDTTEDAYVMQYRYRASEVPALETDQITRLAG
jgi:ribosomal-protein-alanine N-acetyltransferase